LLTTRYCSRAGAWQRGGNNRGSSCAPGPSVVLARLRSWGWCVKKAVASDLAREHPSSVSMQAYMRSTSRVHKRMHTLCLTCLCSPAHIVSRIDARLHTQSHASTRACTRTHMQTHYQMSLHATRTLPHMSTYACTLSASCVHVRLRTLAQWEG